MAIDRKQPAEPRPTPVEDLLADVGLAIGALAVSANPILERVAQSLHEARPLLFALVELGNANAETLAKLTEKHEVRLARF